MWIASIFYENLAMTNGANCGLLRAVTLAMTNLLLCHCEKIRKDFRGNLFFIFGLLRAVTLAMTSAGVDCFGNKLPRNYGLYYSVIASECNERSNLRSKYFPK